MVRQGGQQAHLPTHLGQPSSLLRPGLGSTGTIFLGGMAKAVSRSKVLSEGGVPREEWEGVSSEPPNLYHFRGPKIDEGPIATLASHSVSEWGGL